MKELNRFDMILGRATAVAEETVKATDWTHVSVPTFVAIRACARSAYMQGRVDAATEALEESLRKGEAQARSLAEASQKLADELSAPPAKSMSEVKLLCPGCGAVSFGMVDSAKFPGIHTVSQRCSRCAAGD